MLVTFLSLWLMTMNKSNLRKLICRMESLCFQRDLSSPQQHRWHARKSRIKIDRLSSPHKKKEESREMQLGYNLSNPTLGLYILQQVSTNWWFHNFPKQNHQFMTQSLIEKSKGKGAFTIESYHRRQRKLEVCPERPCFVSSLSLFLLFYLLSCCQEYSNLFVTQPLTTISSFILGLKGWSLPPTDWSLWGSKYTFPLLSCLTRYFWYCYKNMTNMLFFQFTYLILYL